MDYIRFLYDFFYLCFQTNSINSKSVYLVVCSFFSSFHLLSFCLWIFYFGRWYFLFQDVSRFACWIGSSTYKMYVFLLDCSNYINLINWNIICILQLHSRLQALNCCFKHFDAIIDSVTLLFVVRIATHRNLHKHCIYKIKNRMQRKRKKKKQNDEQKYCRPKLFTKKKLTQQQRMKPPSFNTFCT